MMKSASFDKQTFVTFPPFRLFAVCNYFDFPFSILKKELGIHFVALCSKSFTI